MKKLAAILIVSSVALTALFSCKEEEPADFPVDTDSTVTETTDTDNVPTDVISGVQYCRTDGSSPAFEYPYLVVVRSRQELDRYYNAFAGIYHLGRVINVYSDTTAGWLDASDKYDEIFFEEHDLLMAVLEEGSGSIRHEVESITDGVVSIKRISPEVQTCDMAEWHIFIEVHKGTKPVGINTSNRVYTVEDVSDAVLRYVIERAEAYIKNIISLPDAVITGAARTDFASVEDGIDNVYSKSIRNDTPVYILTVQIPESDMTAVLYTDDEGYVFASDGIELPEQPTAPENYGFSH